MREIIKREIHLKLKGIERDNNVRILLVGQNKKTGKTLTVRRMQK